MKNNASQRTTTPETDKTMSVLNRITPTQIPDGFTERVMARINEAQTNPILTPKKTASIYDSIIQLFTIPQFALAIVLCFVAINVVAIGWKLLPDKSEPQHLISSMESGYRMAFDDGASVPNKNQNDKPNVHLRDRRKGVRRD
jgi:hypothetical protein